MSRIRSIRVTERLDYRGNPTIQVILKTSKGSYRSIGPSGASEGDYEAIELQDNDEHRFHGQGVITANRNVNYVLGPAIVDRGFILPSDGSAFDRFMIELDGSSDKSALGANSILGISMCVWRAAAGELDMPLYAFLREYTGSKEPYIMPVPFFNMLNGGVQSGNTMAFQDFMICPVGAHSTTEAVRMGSEVQRTHLARMLGALVGPPWSMFHSTRRRSLTRHEQEAHY